MGGDHKERLDCTNYIQKLPNKVDILYLLFTLNIGASQLLTILV